MPDNEIEETIGSLRRVQDFDPETLSQVERLGQDFNFLDTVESARRVIGLFQQLPEQYVSELSSQRRGSIKKQADSFFSTLEQITKFDTKQAEAYSVRESLLKGISQQYDRIFDELSVPIAYAASRLRDYSALEREARAAIQGAKDRADQAAAELESQRVEAERILEDVRTVALERGVAQQATYFKSESEMHKVEAETWRWRTIYFAIAIGLYALASVLFHKWDWLVSGQYAVIQLAISKLLLFTVLAYMLFLSARNFLAHKHNEIVNRHRYNALLTFTALADAASGEERRDVVLTFAAACIFSPQETGYTKAHSQSELNLGMLQAVPRLVSSGGGSASQ